MNPYDIKGIDQNFIFLSTWNTLNLMKDNYSIKTPVKTWCSLGIDI